MICSAVCCATQMTSPCSPSSHLVRQWLILIHHPHHHVPAADTSCTIAVTAAAWCCSSRCCCCCQPCICECCHDVLLPLVGPSAADHQVQLQLSRQADRRRLACVPVAQQHLPDKHTTNRLQKLQTTTFPSGVHRQHMQPLYLRISHNPPPASLLCCAPACLLACRQRASLAMRSVRWATASQMSGAAQQEQSADEAPRAVADSTKCNAWPSSCSKVLSLLEQLIMPLPAALLLLLLLLLPSATLVLLQLALPLLLMCWLQKGAGKIIATVLGWKAVLPWW